MNTILISSILAIILLSTTLTTYSANADTGKKLIASFVDPKKDPQSYVKRYQNEPTYKTWFDTNFSQYSSIYEAVGLDEPKGLASFVDKSKDPQSYVNRYNNEPKYKKWFDKNYGSKYKSIYEAVGLTEPKKPAKKITCEQGTILKDGWCIADKNYKKQLEKIKVKQQSIEILIKKANAYTVAKWYDKAQKYYDEALKLDPNNQEAKKNKDTAYNTERNLKTQNAYYHDLLDAHRINDAKKECDTLDSYNENECKWYVAMELGNYNDAEKYIKKIRSDLDNPSNYSTANYLMLDVYVSDKEIATLYKQKRYNDLISYLNERIKNSHITGRDNTYEFKAKSLVYEKMNNYEKASEIKGTFNNDCYFLMYGIDYTKAQYYFWLYDYEKAKFYADKLPDDKFYDQQIGQGGCNGDLLVNRFYTFKLNIEETYNQQKNRDFG